LGNQILVFGDEINIINIDKILERKEEKVLVHGEPKDLSVWRHRDKSLFSLTNYRNFRQYSVENLKDTIIISDKPVELILEKIGYKDFDNLEFKIKRIIKNENIDLIKFLKPKLTDNFKFSYEDKGSVNVLEGDKENVLDIFGSYDFKTININRAEKSSVGVSFKNNKLLSEGMLQKCEDGILYLNDKKCVQELKDRFLTGVKLNIKDVYIPNNMLPPCEVVTDIGNSIVIEEDETNLLEIAKRFITMKSVGKLIVRSKKKKDTLFNLGVNKKLIDILEDGGN